MPDCSLSSNHSLYIASSPVEQQYQGILAILRCNLYRAWCDLYVFLYLSSSTPSISLLRTATSVISSVICVLFPRLSYDRCCFC